MKRLAFFVFVFLVTACKVPCSVESVIVGNLPLAIATKLNCTNQTQISADIQRIINYKTVCGIAASKGGPIANSVCPFVGMASVAIFTNSIPADWNCTPTQAGQNLDTVVTALCEALPI